MGKKLTLHMESKVHKKLLHLFLLRLRSIGSSGYTGPAILPHLKIMISEAITYHQKKHWLMTRTDHRICFLMTIVFLKIEDYLVQKLGHRTG